jgi:hypothetical protein
MSTYLPSFRVAGIAYRPLETRRLLRNLPDAGKGLEVKFVPDPYNEYDRNAVKVVLDETFVGFIPRAVQTTYKGCKRGVITKVSFDIATGVVVQVKGCKNKTSCGAVSL